MLSLLLSYYPVVQAIGFPRKNDADVVKMA
jgi:hypothetical protein